MLKRRALDYALNFQKSLENGRRLLEEKMQKIQQCHFNQHICYGINRRYLRFDLCLYLNAGLR